MEQFNLGGSIGQLKVLKEQYFDEMSDERSKELKELIEQAMREN